MYIDFSQWFGDMLPSELCPLVLFVTMMGILFCPFNLMYFSARKWLGVALGRILLSYCFPVEFRDFFIADELNSLSYSFWTCSYFFCAYGWHWIGIPDHCPMSTSWLTPLLASLPPWWRLLQCFRRYKDSNEKVHLINGAKYMSSILATLMSGLRRIHGNQWTLCLWIIISLINSCYTSTWDIKMDWGLMQSNSQYWLLRDELVFHRWAYYMAMPINIALRFSWTLTFFHFHIHGDILGFLIALLEGIRRIQWNIFRLENEHLNNCGQYRAIKEIPLPFAMMEDHDHIKFHQPNVFDQDIIEHGQNYSPPSPTDQFHDIQPPPSPIPVNTSRASSMRHSYQGGSFYGKRDFENKHDREENDFLSTPNSHQSRHISAQSSPLDQVLTRIRSLTTSHNSDVSDTEHEDDLDSDDDDDGDDDDDL
ncbi:EXS family-domain-containing protein [Halteromyces radiatus]|uniref:EXS family-domain-containing protein n=1 Tax=Halteromyces radiatus TaxID=101107 RepID=UPI00221F9BE6|nr:EXS family-domain-containing protein [Halteromyces radiatus]KAI8096292.1 EXS family-domain-containing protein [Halteromyces radiatus]